MNRISWLTELACLLICLASDLDFDRGSGYYTVTQYMDDT